MSSPNRAAWFAAMALLGGAFATCLEVAKAEPVHASHAGFDPPDPVLVRQTAKEILQDPRLRPHKTFWQWLREKLTGWEGPDLALTGGWVKVVVYVLLAWCVLALLAVLGHIVWFLIHLVAGQFSEERRSLRSLGRRADAELTYEVLRARADAFAEQGAYRHAVGTMFVAVLYRLDDAGLVRLHQSKTNGDYVGVTVQPPPG